MSSRQKSSRQTARTRPDISVIISSYNNGKYLREAIDSVLAQTLKPQEIIVCDDCSTDESWSIIEEYEKNFPDLIKGVRLERNHGGAHTFNTGLKLAKGKFLTYVAGDDRFLPRKLELEWRALQKRPAAGLAYSDVIVTTANGNRQRTWLPADIAAPEGDVFVPVFSKAFFPDNRSLFRNPLVDRSVFDASGYFDESLRLYEDWDLLIRLSANCDVVFSGEPLVEYRIHDEGLHTSEVKERCHYIETVFDKNKQLLGKTKAQKVYVQEQIDKLLRGISGGTSQSHHVPHAGSDDCIPFILNSLPKSGTHLLEKVITGLGDFKYGNLHLDTKLTGLHATNKSCGPLMPAGVENPHLVASDPVRQWLKQLQEHEYATAHMPFSPAFNAVIQQLGLRMVLILRDPRDVVVSHAHYVASTPVHFLYEVYQPLSEEERLMASIAGVGAGEVHAPMCLDIRRRYQNMLGWCAQPYVYTTYFEKLVGPDGGGNAQIQEREIAAIARHLGYELQPEKAQSIARGAFGASATFHKGQIGGWRERFSAEHKKVFKRIAGQLLVDLGYESNLNW